MQPRRRWWRRKRCAAALALVAVLAYPLAFVPACWTLTWIGPRPASAEWATIRWAYRPVAVVLIASPAPVQRAASGVVELGAPSGVEFRVNRFMVLAVWPGDDPSSSFMVQVW